MKKNIAQVQTLLEALPYIKRYKNEIFVIKYGGSAQLNPTLKEKFARDIILMYLVGIKPVIVHGGGNAIGKTLDKMRINSHFVDGLRVTTKEIMEVVEMVLSGTINNEITTLLNMHGGKAVGMSGKDANFLQAQAINQEKYGYVGKITKIDPSVIERMISEKFIPVIAPIGAYEQSGHPGFNINADTAAAHIAVALNARKVIFMTDTLGVLDENKELFHTLNEEQIDTLKEEEIIVGGMIPKVDACLHSINGGVSKAHILDGRVEHALLLEIFTSKGIGTVIKL